MRMPSPAEIRRRVYRKGEGKAMFRNEAGTCYMRAQRKTQLLLWKPSFLFKTSRNFKVLIFGISMGEEGGKGPQTMGGRAFGQAFGRLAEGLPNPSHSLFVVYQTSHLERHRGSLEGAAYFRQRSERPFVPWLPAVLSALQRNGAQLIGVLHSDPVVAELLHEARFRFWGFR